MRSTIAAAFVLLAACSGKDTADTAPGFVTGWKEVMSNNGDFMVMWQAAPEPIPLNDIFQLSVMVHDSTGDTMLMSSELTAVDATMPAHGHGMNTAPLVTANGDGSFVVDGMMFHMAGEWEIVFDVADQGVTDTAATLVDCCG
jgi:hypothetical protein